MVLTFYLRNPQFLAQKVNKTINEWSKSSSKLVIAIDGYTGIGKTTLLQNLSTLNSEIIPVHRDDFLLPRTIVQQKLAEAKDRSEIFQLKVYDNKKLQDFILAFKNKQNFYDINSYNSVSGKTDVNKTFDFSKKIMVIEGVFMFHPKLLVNPLWDKKIYLEGDIHEIDTRRVAREKQKWGKNYVPETDPDSHFRQVIIGLKRYIDLYKPDKAADAVFMV